MKICPLSSGSKGNSTLIETKEHRILVDSGLSAKRLVERLGDIEVDIETIDGVLITHEHSDHIGGAGVLARKYNIPIYIHPQCQAAANKKIFQGTEKLINFDFSIEFSDLAVEAISLSHDAAQPLAFIFHHQDFKAAVITDLGHVTNLVRLKLQDCNALVLEMNHDPEMLKKNPNYSWPLKQRIMSKYGHLSNEDGARLLNDVISEKLQTVYLAHLSEENNDPSLVRDVLDKINDGNEHYRKIDIHLAYQDKVSELTEL